MELLRRRGVWCWIGLHVSQLFLHWNLRGLWTFWTLVLRRFYSVQGRIHLLLSHRTVRLAMNPLGKEAARSLRLQTPLRAMHQEPLQ